MMDQLASKRYALGVSSNRGKLSELLDSMKWCRTTTASEGLWDDSEDPVTLIRGWSLAPSGDRLPGGDTDQSELRQ